MERLKKLWKKYNTTLVYLLWFGLIAGILSLAVFLFAASRDIPSFSELENPEYDLASVIYSDENEIFGTYYIENRLPVQFDDLPKDLVDALVSTEDARFFKHNGVDFRALGRVAVKTVILRQDSGGGGSTISQQLAKLLFKRPNLNGKNAISKIITLVQVKFKEWLTSIRLERQYTKEEIIAMYLNKFEFINGAHGIYAAADTYFGKSLDSLRIEENAVLVGMLKNPSLYNPVRFPEKAFDRRNVVLKQMERYNKIDRAQYDSLKVVPLDMTSFTRETQSEGVAPYFRSELTKWLRTLLKTEEYKKPNGEEYNIYTDGLKIYTTINLDYQRAAEASVTEHMAGLQERYFKRWKGKNIFTFEAEDFQEEIRREAFDRRVRNSERYKGIYFGMMGKSLKALSDKFPEIRTGPLMIRSMTQVEDVEKDLKTLVRKTIVRKDEISFLKKVLKSKEFADVKKTYEKFNAEYEKQFNQEIEMMVFAYNDKGEELKTMTPLDSVMYHYQHLQAGMVSMEPGTGYVKSWVGGVGHKYFKYDHVNSRRQVGSTIKPFVYASAISFGSISPCTTYEDIQYTIAPGDALFDLTDEWSPANANEKFTGNPYNLYQGLLYSKNSITVRLVKEMGSVTLIRDLLDNAGIDKNKLHPNGEPIVPYVPSLCLGALDLTVMEMVGAYGIWPNNGTYVQPVFVSRIEDKNGKILYTAVPKRKMALNPTYNAVMVDMLRNNVGGNFGLGGKSDVGGKTGTTNDYADGWFMTITPKLVVGTWVGGDDKWIRFFTLDEGQGFVMARPIAKKFFSKLEADETINYDAEVRFPEPTGATWDLIDCNKFKEIRPEDEALQRQQEVEELFDEEEFDEEFDDDF